MPAPVASSNAPTGKAGAAVDIPNIINAESKESRDQIIADLVATVKAEGPAALLRLNFVDSISAGINDKKSPVARENACSIISSLCEQGAGQSIEPYVFDTIVPTIVSELFGDKVQPVRDASLDAIRSLAQIMSPWSTTLILPCLLSNIKTSGKWQVKTGALEILKQLVVSAPQQIASATPDIIPVLSEAIWDTKADVKKSAKDTLEKTTGLISNKDIEKFIPALINTLLNPSEVPKTIELLSATTFVTEVDSPTLSLMVPLLTRGLKEKTAAIKRRVAVITENMSRLVADKYTVRPFLPRLLPELIKIQPTVADPEARGKVDVAIKTLRSVGEVTGDGSNLPPLPTADPATIGPVVMSSIKAAESTTQVSVDTPIVKYITSLACNISNGRQYEESEWEASLAPYYSFVIADASKTKKAIIEVQNESIKMSGGTGELKFDDEEDGEDLCNCTFSLAYGAKILLNNTSLRLKRGHRYGVCGRNGTGKTTLMRAINNEQVNGFPPADEVRRIFVEHDIDGSHSETSVFNYIRGDENIKADDAEIRETLETMGFSAEKQSDPIASLSGGWKMKLALARAILFKADILLLDEPTNHLDVVNIKWLEDTLTSLTNTTSLIVSHDSGFLNRTVTDILHINNRYKVKRYPGNLDKFVEYVPEAKTYFELDALEEYRFKFPPPTLLDGVKTKEKSIIKMRNVGYKYPTGKEQLLFDISLQVSLSSRVAILGPNGSGKTTLVNLLVGAIENNCGGSVWRHPALNIGYIHQHAFDHIDKYLDQTAVDYLVDRYRTGEDKEEFTKASVQISAADEEKMKEGANITVEGQRRVIEDVLNRKKLKQSYEYEVSFVNHSSADNIWISRDELHKRGFEKKTAAVDSREAQKAGLLRPLVRKEIEAHMADFGLEPEFVTHNTLRGLSGGQKVKVVLAAATWRRPHVVILDEPTNYLDRESLAALIAALKDFEGGVLVITHSREFSESLCTEVWAMKQGRLEPSGHNWVEGQGTGPRIDQKEDEEDKFDAMGNKIDAPKKAKKISASDARKKKKERMARRKRGEEVFSDEDDL